MNLLQYLKAAATSFKRKRFQVVDPMGRVINEWDTLEEANRASEARRYAKVIDTKKGTKPGQ